MTVKSPYFSMAGFQSLGFSYLDISFSMGSESHDKEFLAKLDSAHTHMRGRIDDYVEAWNKGDMETIMNTFVDEGLDYSDYGQSSRRSKLCVQRRQPAADKKIRRNERTSG